MSLDIARILVGLLLLVIGRRLFWFFVGAVGFVAGMRFAAEYMHGQSDQTTIIFALVCGIISMGLAIFLRKVALGAAGFLAGGYLLLQLTQMHPVAPLDQYPLLAFVAGGVIGALLISVVFNWTLIVLSSLGGAALICESLKLQNQTPMIVFTVLAIAGVLVQTGLLKRVRGGA